MIQDIPSGFFYGYFEMGGGLCLGDISLKIYLRR